MPSRLQNIPLTTIAGQPGSLADHAGKVMLVVNVASQCGLTPQYEALERVFEKYRDQGLVILGFPANNFGAQEPGSDEEISEFCVTRYGASFPMFSKTSVKGEDQHPLYAEMIRQMPAPTAGDPAFPEKLARYGFITEKESDVLWNFEKFLIGRDGLVAARFRPDITPEDPVLTEAIEAELAKAPVAA